VPRNQLFEPRQGSAATWASVNPVLAAQEMGLESDTRRVKFGDGASAWASLPYAYGGFVGPSGDTTGVTDTANFEAALANGGVVNLAPYAAVYYITNLTLLAGEFINGQGHTITRMNGPAGATGAMVLVPATVQQAVFIKGVYMDCSLASYSYGIEFATPASQAPDWSILNDVWVYDCGGIGVYYSGNRGGLVMRDCNVSSCFGGGVDIGGADVILDTLTVDFCEAYGLSISGSMCHVRDLDCYNNGNAGTYVHISQVFFTRCTWDQNNGPGLVVDSGAVQVFVGGRFTANGLLTTNTYPHADIHAAGANGVTFMPDCWFNAVEFGHPQVTTYDILSGGVAFYDYSQFAGTSSTGGHVDEPAGGLPADPLNIVAASGAAQTLAAGHMNRYVLSANCTFTLPPAVAGSSFTAKFVQPATGGPYTPTITSADYGSAGTPTWSTAANKADIVVGYCDDGATWQVILSGTGF
jgi:hypothetical protein